MFFLDDQNFSQSEQNSVDPIGLKIPTRIQSSINSESKESMSNSKSEIYRKLERNINMFPEDMTGSVSNSRFENLILNGSNSLATSSFIHLEEEYSEFETTKISNCSPVEIIEFETIDLVEGTVGSTTGTRERTNFEPRTNNEVVGSYVGTPPDEERGRIVMIIVIGTVIIVTLVIITVGKYELVDVKRF